MTEAVCFWCREPRGDQIMNPGVRGDYLIADYRPCTSCNEKFAHPDNIVIVEYDNKPVLDENQFAIEDAGTPQAKYPTGRWVVLDPSEIMKLRIKVEQLAKIQKAGAAYFDRAVFEEHFPAHKFQTLH